MFSVCMPSGFCFCSRAHVSNETSWPSSLFYFFSWIVAEWRVPDLHINFYIFIKIDFTLMFFFMTLVFAMLFP